MIQERVTAVQKAGNPAIDHVAKNTVVLGEVDRSRAVVLPCQRGNGENALEISWVNRFGSHRGARWSILHRAEVLPYNLP